MGADERFLAAAVCACHFGHWCLPCSLAGSEGAPALVQCKRRRIAAGDVLLHAGDALHCIHALTSGALKTSLTAADGHEQVCGFPMVGDVVGLDGAFDGRHQTTVTALEDSQTWAVPYAPLLELAAGCAALQRGLTGLLGREIARGQTALRMLHGHSAQQRLAAFLLDLSERSKARGHAADEFNLRMTRGDLGSYLGLSLETVSRTFSQFRLQRLLDVDRRRVRIVDMAVFRRRLEHWGAH